MRYSISIWLHVIALQIMKIFKVIRDIVIISNAIKAVHGNWSLLMLWDQHVLLFNQYLEDPSGKQCMCSIPHHFQNIFYGRVFHLQWEHWFQSQSARHTTKKKYICHSLVIFCLTKTLSVQSNYHFGLFPSQCKKDSTELFALLGVSHVTNKDWLEQQTHAVQTLNVLPLLACFI